MKWFIFIVAAPWRVVSVAAAATWQGVSVHRWSLDITSWLWITSFMRLSWLKWGRWAQLCVVPSADFYQSESLVLNVKDISIFSQGCRVESREHQLGRPATWTGTGFAWVPEGGTLEFLIGDIPYSMEYDLLIRYESQVCLIWVFVLPCCLGLMSLDFRKSVC